MGEMAGNERLRQAHGGSDQQFRDKRHGNSGCRVAPEKRWFSATDFGADFGADFAKDWRRVSETDNRRFSVPSQVVRKRVVFCGRSEKG
jgi:hypothetical protein